MSAGPFLAITALAAVIVSCNEPAPPIAEPATAPMEAADPAIEADPVPSAWPTDVEDLTESLTRFGSVETCLEALRRETPTAIAEGISDLEYDGFFDDVCRATAAVRDRSRQGCDAIEVSTIRRGCRRRLAIVAGDPSLCPDDLVLEGRDPMCVAWAARDPGLCRATGETERGACEAVLARDPSRCARSPDRARCEAWIRRYGSALGTERTSSAGTREDPALRLEIVHVVPSTSGAASSATPEIVETDQLARGVLLAADGCERRVVLDHRGERAQIVGARGTRIELPIAAGPIPIRAGGASIQIAHPSLGRARGGEGRIVIDAFEPARGAALRGTIEASLPMPPGEWRVRGTFHTFVRDLADLPAACAGDRMRAP